MSLFQFMAPKRETKLQDKQKSNVNSSKGKDKGKEIEKIEKKTSTRKRVKK